LPRFIVFVFFLALILRLGWVYFNTAPPTRIDSAEHDILAQNLAEGYGYCYYAGVPTSYRPPLYPFYLSIIYRLFGHKYYVAYLFESLIGSLTTIMIYLISIQFFTPRVAKIASLICAMYPTYIQMVTELMTENLFTFLVALFIFGVILLKSRGNATVIVLTGVVLGLSALCRATMLPIIFLFPLCGAFSDENTVRGFRKALWVSVIALGVMSPWVVRNYIVHNALVLVDTHGGATFHYNHNLITKEGYYWKAAEGLRQKEIAKEIEKERARILAGESVRDVFLKKAARGHLEGLSRIAPERAEELAKLSEVERNKAFWREGIEAIMKYPMMYFKHFLKEVVKFWHIFNDEGRFLPFYSFLLPFYFIGVLVSLGRIRRFAILHLLMINIWAICAIINNGTRFRAPFETIVMMIALNGIFWLYDNLRSRAFVHFLVFADLLLNLFFIFTQNKLRLLVKKVFQSLGFDVVPF